MPTIGESPRMQALKKMSQQFPAANQKAAQGQQAARQIQLQQQVAQAPQGLGVRAAQATGAQQAGQAGQIAVDAAKQGQAQQTQIGQLGLQERGRQLRGAQAAGEQALQKEQLDFSQKLNNMGQDIKQELFDKQMEFKKDELNRTVFNTRQMIDWTIEKAQSAEELKDYQQAMAQMMQRKDLVMKQAYEVVASNLQNAFKQAEQENDQELKKFISDLERTLKEQENEQKRKSAVDAAKIGAVTNIITSPIKAIP